MFHYDYITEITAFKVQSLVQELIKHVKAAPWDVIKFLDF